MTSIHAMQLHNEETGSPREKCTTAAITPAPAGIGIPTKYFFPGRPGFDGCGFDAMLKRARRLAPAIRKRKLETAPNWIILPVNSVDERNIGNCRNPHIQASR